jgi:hypothetical protein
MASAAEYRQYARECLEWADKAENEAERKHFLSMARAWTQAALRLEGLMVPHVRKKPLRMRERKFL